MCVGPGIRGALWPGAEVTKVETLSFDRTGGNQPHPQQALNLILMSFYTFIPDLICPFFIVVLYYWNESYSSLGRIY